MPSKKPKIPSFRSDAAEQEFWSKHSVEEFAAELADLDVKIRPARTMQIAVRLYKEDLEALRELAEKKGVGHTTLARSILEQWLAQVRASVQSPPRRPRPAT